jgi:anaerobic magnesium-protoporphyrin IX monomethyl ester cyclase
MFGACIKGGRFAVRVSHAVVAFCPESDGVDPMTDLVLLFPPQWSPFQPALSLPSLSAWLKRAGFTVASLDLNVLFYHWLLSDQAASALADQAKDREWNDPVREAYVATFRSVGTFRNDIASLRQAPSGAESPQEYVTRNYLAIKSLETYLLAVSTVSKSFTISPYEFRLSSGNLNSHDLEAQVASPPPLIEQFLRSVVEEHVLPLRAGAIGISCIGQEQLYFTLLLGRIIKALSNAPVLVGGTIFSRIFERGVLHSSWFGRYFDLIVRNEGEKPTEQVLANIAAGRPLGDGAPGLVRLDGSQIVSSPPCAALGVTELPVPDFDDLPLTQYISTEVTLPLLSARGCYWGKCEFCHHGMVYGEKYAPYAVERVLDTVSSLAARYQVRHFAFNDEALPPKTARAIGRIFPPHRDSGWTFTGLIKFEPFYTREDFAGMQHVGFRSLYVGLESASERVLERMKKNCKRTTVLANLTHATEAGIWMHCFLFFGFPGETESEARETYDFVLNHPDIIGSFGAGTFSLEHNAPIFYHYQDLGVTLRVLRKSDVDVYYDYNVAGGISADRALQWQQQLTRATSDVPNYIAAKWVPRELLLCMLSVMTPEELRGIGLTLRDAGGIPCEAPLSAVTSRTKRRTEDGSRLVINRLNGRALILNGTAARLFDLCYDNAVELGEIRADAPILYEKLSFAREPRETREV